MMLLGLVTFVLSACGGEAPAGDDAGRRDAHVEPDAWRLSPALAYCGCMLRSCHDDIHARWGVSDEEAIAACELEASALAEAALMCRQTSCEEAVGEDPTACAAALGGAPCM